jgi:nucleotide-binding universal stress UspA family protein
MPMTYQTILVHCDESAKASTRLDVATELAGRFNALLVGLHGKPPFEVPAFSDGAFATEPIFEAYEEAAKANLAASRAAFDKAIKGKHLRVEWRVLDDYPEEGLAMAARYADLLVVGQSTPDAATPGNLPESVAMATGRPVLVVPHIGADKPPGKKVMLCWNASRESARSASDALPFLKAAEEVIVFVVDPKAKNTDHGAEPGADVAAWLSRHGVKVTVRQEFAVDSDIGNVIVSRAADLDVDLIVMGIYGHSRVRELVVGGVSRTLLASMTVPVLMSH